MTHPPDPTHSSQSHPQSTHLYPPSVSSSTHHHHHSNSSNHSIITNSIKSSKPLSHLISSNPSLHLQTHLKTFNQTFALSSLSTLAEETKNFRIQGWDPILIITQILALQSLHYLTLSILIPPLLTLFAKPIPLEYEGGPTNVGMIMDWRQMVGYGTLHHSSHKLGGWAGYGKLPNPLGRRPLRVGSTLPLMKIDSGLGQPTHGLVDRIERGLGTDWAKSLQDSMTIDLAADSNRSWILAAAWFMASLMGVWYLYHIVRRPIHIMDHSLTIILNHLILTTYYSSHFPSSVWFYFVLMTSSILQIVWAENLCVKREMREGLGVGWKIDQRPEDVPLMNSLGSGSLGHSLNHTIVNLNGVSHDPDSLNDEIRN
ncbi:integral membrane protein S linking to the trans Golgi network-domain-containing protein [Melampsora americana]|nr:integral membrane protein S linking to the trans Golgi network-domain-containing protein [Melampsora americana]